MPNDENYDVTDVREYQEMTPGGTRRTTHRVWITTDRGSTGSVEIEEVDWTEERIAEILEEKAQELDLPYTATEG